MSLDARLHSSNRAIYLAALEIADERERQAFVENACAGDARRREEIERLLAARSASAVNLVDRAVEQLGPGETLAGEPALDVDVSHHPMIDRYKLLEQIGEGGMGAVYMAQQTDPVRRKVALKLIKPGMDSREVIARFEAERQALAMMDHPNIARVLDAGTTPQGRPYFVMELVRGMPITEYCDQERLSIDRRLRLFMDVCRAVQHAHQKGIIHRDLKPSNVMVTLHDGKPVVKVIDFGVAKALNDDLTRHTLFTQFSQMIGTPLYMSPEQAEMSGLDIDTRSDIYSLGVLLYELLTGTTPFDPETFSRAGYDGMRRIICEQDPPRPSHRISTLAAQLQSTTSSRRNIDTRHLVLSMRRELDWIAMKALEKDRDRRYESASSLAAEIQRYLDDETIQACPPSFTYQAKKFVRRNRALVLASAAIGAALLLGTGVSLWQATRATFARDRAQAAEKLASAETQRARSERQRAEVNFNKALEAVDRLLYRVGDESLSDVPRMEKIQIQVLRDAVEFYNGFLTERSDPQLRLKTAIAYVRIGEIHGRFDNIAERDHAMKTASKLLEQLHIEQPENITIQATLGDLYTTLGWHARDTETVKEQHLRRAIELLAPLAERPNGGRRLANSYRSLGNVLRKLRRFEESERAFEKTLALCEHYPGQGDDIEAQTFRNLSDLLNDRGRVAESIEAMRQARDRWGAIVQAHPHVTGYRADHAENSAALGELLMRERPTAESLLQIKEGRELWEGIANDFPAAGVYRRKLKDSRNALIRAYRQLKRDDEAVQMVDQLAPATAEEYLERAELYESLADDSKALADFTEALRQDPKFAAAYAARAALHSRQGRPAEAMADIAELMALEPLDERARVAEHERIIVDLNSAGQYQHAFDLAEALIKAHPSSSAGWYQRAQAHFNMKRYEDAAEDYAQAAAHTSKKWWLYKRRGLSYFNAGRYDEALAAIAKAVELDYSDTTNLTWIDAERVAGCPDENFRQGMLDLADKTVQLTNGNIGAYRARCSLYAAMGKYREARSDFEAAVAAGLADKHTGWYERYQLALTGLALDDAAGYSAACVEMLERFRDSQEPRELSYVAWTCALAPGAVDDYAPVIELAQRAVERENRRHYLNGLGAILMRSGQYEEAKLQLEAALLAAPDIDLSISYIHYFLAMTEHHLGDHEVAQKHLAVANKLAEEELTGEVSWNRKLTIRLLRDEAAALTASNKPDDDSL